MAVAYHAWPLLFPILVNDTLANSIELLNILGQHRQVVLNDLGMLKLSVKYYSHYRVDALPNARNDLPGRLDPIFCL